VPHQCHISGMSGRDPRGSVVNLDQSKPKEL
jgi:hypothetical protein